MLGHNEIELAQGTLKGLAHFFGETNSKGTKVTPVSSNESLIDLMEPSPEKKEFKGEIRSIFVSCVGHKKTSLKPAEMQSILAALEKHSQKPRIYIEEANQQAREEWFNDNQAILESLYPDSEERKEKVSSVFTMRECSEWKKLHDMLVYFLLPEGEQKEQKAVELSKVLSEVEKNNLFKQEKKEILEAIRNNLISKLAHDATTYATSRTPNTDELEAAIRDSKNHFIDVATDLFYFMMSTEYKGTPYRTAILHTHGLPQFIRDATKKLSERFSCKYSSIADITVRFPEENKNINQEVMKNELPAPNELALAAGNSLNAPQLLSTSPHAVTFKPTKKLSPPGSLRQSMSPLSHPGKSNMNDLSGFFVSVVAATLVEQGPQMAAELTLALTLEAERRESERKAFSRAQLNFFPVPPASANIGNIKRRPSIKVASTVSKQQSF